MADDYPLLTECRVELSPKIHLSNPEFPTGDRTFCGRVPSTRLGQVGTINAKTAYCKQCHYGAFCYAQNTGQVSLIRQA